MRIKFSQKGDFKNVKKFLTKSTQALHLTQLDYYGKQGVAALAAATPIDSGLTASSWYYEITRSQGKVEISFHNSNVNKGVPIAIILQYGHGTRNGGWVQGRDYINPAIQPFFDNLAEAAWREVTSL